MVLRRTAAVAIGLLAMLTAASAQAQDQSHKFNTAADAGVFWFFLYDTHAQRIRVDPAPAASLDIFQLADFSWARNMAAEVNYLFVQSRGYIYDRESPTVAKFYLTMHNAAANIGYFFEGRKLHPYLFLGFGAGYFIFDPMKKGAVGKEVDPILNASPGVDYTVRDAPQDLLKRIDLGFRVRYFLIFEKRLVDTAADGLVLNARLNLRW
jgi:hypothetical protein